MTHHVTGEEEAKETIFEGPQRERLSEGRGSTMEALPGHGLWVS